jgi:hypothetical protein
MHVDHALASKSFCTPSYGSPMITIGGCNNRYVFHFIGKFSVVDIGQANGFTGGSLAQHLLQHLLNRVRASKRFETSKTKSVALVFIEN